MRKRKSSIVFSPGCIGTLELKNRLVRSGTFENAGTEEGDVSETLLTIYHALAKGGVGLIVTGVMPVLAQVAAPRQVRIHHDACIPGLAKVPRAVHEAAPDCKIVAQLGHPGRQLPDAADAARFASYLPPALIKALQETYSAGPVQAQPHHVVEATAPSALFDPTFDKTPRALGSEEIEEIIDAFVEGIRRTREAGFDGVQLHAAHGWLLSSFLSPHTNHRDDRFGGSTSKRTQIVTEILARARQKVGTDFPVLVKMNTTDFLPDGMNVEEAARVGEILSGAGFAALEASGGMWEAMTRGRDELGWLPYLIPEARVNVKTREDEAYFLTGARALKRRTHAPIILVGGLRSIGRIEEILQEGSADFFALARPLVRQPDLPNRWLTGEGPDRSECLSCNACLPMGVDPLSCKSKRSA